MDSPSGCWKIAGCWERVKRNRARASAREWRRKARIRKAVTRPPCAVSAAARIQERELAAIDDISLEKRSDWGRGADALLARKTSGHFQPTKRSVPPLAGCGRFPPVL